MEDIKYMGIGIKEREQEPKHNPVKVYYLEGEELEKYRSIKKPTEKMDPGSKIVMKLNKRVRARSKKGEIS